MATTITIRSTDYSLPQQGENPKWGEQLSDIIEALADGLNDVQGEADILETSASILNTVGSKNIIGLAFDTSNVRSCVTSYNLSRKITKTISTIPTGTGTILITCAHNHDLYTDDEVTITGSNSTPSIDGTYTITKNSDTTFTITIGTPVTVAGNVAEFEIELLESGEIALNYGKQGWGMSIESLGDSKVKIDFNSSGQGTYEPTVLDGSSYTGTIRFLAKAILSA